MGLKLLPHLLLNVPKSRQAGSIGIGIENLGEGLNMFVKLLLLFRRHGITVGIQWFSILIFLWRK